MDQITRRMGDGWRTFNIYTEEEAINEKFIIVPWRDAKPGDWALSDDGYVGKCLRVFEPGKCRLITLTYGVEWAHSKYSLLYQERLAIKNWSRNNMEAWDEREARKTRSRNAIIAYVTMLISTSKVDWAVLGRIYRPANATPIAQVRRDFKTRGFKNMIQQELEKVLIEHGSSPKRVIEMYDEAFKEAKSTHKPGDMISVADRFSELWRVKENLSPNGELPAGLGHATILEGVSEDLQLAKEVQPGGNNGK